MFVLLPRKNDIIPGQGGEKKSRRELEWLVTSSRVLGYTLAGRCQKAEIKKIFLESYLFPVLLYCAQPWLLLEKEREYTRKFSAEDGTENTACCLERQSDECLSKAENRHGHRGNG